MSPTPPSLRRWCSLLLYIQTHTHKLARSLTGCERGRGKESFSSHLPIPPSLPPFSSYCYCSPGPLARSSSSTSHNYLCSRSFRPSFLPPPLSLFQPPLLLPCLSAEGRQGLCQDGVGRASVSSSFPSFTINAHVLVHSFVRLWLCGLLGRSSSSGSLIWFSMSSCIRVVFYGTSYIVAVAVLW